MSEFASRLIAWQSLHGRADLPWLRTRDPYRVWLSEVMLQQTQVTTVLGYYARFLDRFPSVTALAAAELDAVMPLWAGLGYYARARNLHACAQAVVARHGGEFPRSAQALAQLPGIGRSTAAAIAAFCFDERAPILDGNVKRVLARHFGIEGFPGAAPIERRLWSLATDLLPTQERAMPAYTQAIMDLGATVCTRRAPRCDACPVRASCLARRDGRIDALPTARPLRVAPQRTAHWLILLRDEAVLLHARPPVGLWGGLLVPPEFKTLCALEGAGRQLGARVRPAAWPARRHAFTHFTLTFTPHIARADASAWAVSEPGPVWLPLSQIDAAALPAPVRALLRDVRGACASMHTAPRRSTIAARPAAVRRTPADRS